MNELLSKSGEPIHSERLGMAAMEMVQHQANSPEAIMSAVAQGADWVEIDVQRLRGVTFWSEDLRARHDNGPFPHFFYPKVEELLELLPPGGKTGVVFDLKYYFEKPMSDQITNLLHRAYDQGRERLAVTGGKPHIMGQLQQEFPNLQTWLPLRKEQQMNSWKDLRVSHISASASVLSRPLLRHFANNNISTYVWGIGQDQIGRWLHAPVKGLILDNLSLIPSPPVPSLSRAA